ncbi:MAG: hypothetical protein KGJ13_03900 [Patescibacteria group bacterium]|nr:hypothetical protein [Patescibacteria group bacterium]
MKRNPVQSKKWILRFRAVDKKNFEEIKNGLKAVETRAATPKYREIKRGDILLIACGKLRLEKEVKRVRVFRTIGAMAKQSRFGGSCRPWGRSPECARYITAIRVTRKN